MPLVGKKRQINAGDMRQPEQQSVQISVSLSEAMMTRLIKMRKAKGMTKEQPLIRLFISEGLDRAGF